MIRLLEFMVVLAYQVLQILTDDSSLYVGSQVFLVNPENAVLQHKQHVCRSQT